MSTNFVSSFFFGADNDAQAQLNEQVIPVIERCYEDEAFKESFIASPRQVIANETGLDVSQIPEKYQFYVVDKSDPRGIYIHIPVNEDALELSDEELEAVAGGIGGANGFLCFENLFCGKKKAGEAPSEG